ncbi:type VI secretion system baseplate subunit TssF/IglH [Fangia hongkongensis]|uniref:type VI secretion system baseplate subunit TssF/IglH n=1 Tax=Fangia hongkongensis TaxID=270495 RepID=UPI00036EA0A9|nr:type VI secretion system baseplate subunit TssF/IglH [Fangia hongkongensis]MBK2123964.1 hypothetical protein [Fangia hongkongensis]
MIYQSNKENVLLSILDKWKVKAEKSFESYAQKVLLSKLQQHFSKLAMPSVEGVFVKAQNISINTDTEIVEYDQRLNINAALGESALYSMQNVIIMPYDVVAQNFIKGVLSCRLAHASQSFELKHKRIELWFLPEHCSTLQALALFQSFSEEVSISYEDLYGEVHQMKAKAEFGCDYPLHINQRIKNKLSDPRIEFKITILLSAIADPRFKWIDVKLKNHTHSASKIDFHEALKTNIIVMGNQRKCQSSMLVMDGHKERYKLSLEDAPEAYQIYDVMAVHAAQQILEATSYRTIYDEDKVSLEFNSVLPVINQKIQADIYVHFHVNQDYFDTTSSLKWHANSISYYDLAVTDLIASNKVPLQMLSLESLMRLLNLQFIEKWQVESWRQILAFFDQYVGEKISTLLINVERNNGGTTLNFMAEGEIEKNWIGYYICQLERFVKYHMSHSNIKLKGGFV